MSLKSIIIFAAGALLLFSTDGLTAGKRQGIIPGRFNVKIYPKANINAMHQSLANNERLNRLSAAELSTNLVQTENVLTWYTFTTDDTTLEANDVATLLGHSNVISVEPDYYVEFFDWPTDSLFENQWYLNNTGQDYEAVFRIEGINNDFRYLTHGLPGADIRINSYYDNPPPETTRVVVAIVDTGIDPDHPEFVGRLWRNVDEVPGNDLDDDHNGYIDDISGYDVSGDSLTVINVVGDNDPTDYVGHGSHLAGIVGANADDKGVTGIAPWVELMPVKITPNATASVGAAGIIYAVSAGAQVINISWGSAFESGILQEALNFARNNGVFVSIAAGNSGTTERFYPAAYDSAFTVAAGNSDGNVTYFSTYGAHIDLVAPGQDILSVRASGTDMNAEAGEPLIRIVADEYYLADGTSMAAPMVAGAAALALSFRPDLSLHELEDALLNGARDMLDPFGQGDSLAGYDTLSGFGFLDINRSLELLAPAGIYFTEPIRRSRYTGDVDVKIASLGSYSGGWLLEYSAGFGNSDWAELASGTTIPSDSLIYSFNDGLQGQINLRLTDDNGRFSTINFTYVRERKVELTTPQTGTQITYNAVIAGSVYGPNFDSMSISYQRGLELERSLMVSTGEYFDSLIFIWSASGSDTGSFNFYLHGYFDDEEIVDTSSVIVASSFTAGWPQQLPSVGGIAPVCADLNHDGNKEVIVTSASGLCLYTDNGILAPGFPVMPLMDMRSIPAIYDVDQDGVSEMICTNDSGIYAIKMDGSYADGWPVYCFTGDIPYGYGFPNPTVAELSYHDLINGSTTLVRDSAIMIINKAGQLLAYNFDGSSYFYSLGGLFAYFDKRASDIFRQGGETSPFITSADLDGDDETEVIASFSAPFSSAGIAVFKGKNGQPAYHSKDPIVLKVSSIYGTALADMDGDELPEIITAGHDSSYIPQIWAVTKGNQIMDGFPVAMPDVQDWIASYPVLADLDLDGIPEILITFFELDITALYIFKADGTAYHSVDGRPYGEALYQQVTFATPTVANISGDEYPEIIIRSGYIFPGSGPEKLFVLDHLGQIMPGWPINTPSRPNLVFSSRMAATVEDVDSDGKVEVMMVGDGSDILVWDFTAASNNGKNTSRFLYDNLNSGIYHPTQLPTSVGPIKEPGNLPGGFTLFQNYPNPFNPVTRIKFELPRAGKVKLEVYNILGQSVSTLIDEILSPGTYSYDFDASAYASGVYFYRLESDDFNITRKMLFLK